MNKLMSYRLIADCILHFMQASRQHAFDSIEMATVIRLQKKNLSLIQVVFLAIQIFHY